MPSLLTVPRGVLQYLLPGGFCLLPGGFYLPPGGFRLLPWGLRCLLLGFLVWSQPGLTAGEPYGKAYVAADDPEFRFRGPDPAIPDEARTREIMGQAAQLRDKLQELEYRDGPYGPGLAEPLGDLARLLEEAGDDALAMEVRERALHLLRVNEGLSSPAQGPLVRAMLDSLRRRGEFEALDARYNYFFRLYGAGRPPWNAPRWNAMLEYLHWQRQALVLGLDGDIKPRLLDLYELQDDLLKEVLEGELTMEWARFRDLALSQLKTMHLVEDFIQPTEDRLERRNNYRAPEDPTDFDLRRERLENLHRSLRGRGRNLLEEALLRIPPDAVVDRAEVELALADWLQWYGATREARGRYEKLWSDLENAGRGDLQEAWFASPTPLPAGGAFFVDARPASPPVGLQVEVSESGRARAAPTMVPEGLERIAGRLRRLLITTRFRPAIRDGVVIAAPVSAGRWSLLDP